MRIRRAIPRSCSSSARVRTSLYRAVREDPGLAPSVAAFNARLREIVAAWAADRLGCDPGDLEPQLFAETAVAVRETVLRLWSVAPAETGVGALTDAAFRRWAAGFGSLGGPTPGLSHRRPPAHTPIPDFDRTPTNQRLVRPVDRRVRTWTSAS